MKRTYKEKGDEKKSTITERAHSRYVATYSKANHKSNIKSTQIHLKWPIHHRRVHYTLIQPSAGSCLPKARLGGNC